MTTNAVRMAALAGAALGLGASAAARPTYDYTGGPVPIPDLNGGPATAEVVVGDSFSVSDVVVRLRVTHTYQGDMVFILTHVDTGTSVTLVERPGSPQTTFGFAADNYGAAGPVYFAVTDSAAGKYDVPLVVAPGIVDVTGNWKPESPLALFIGETSVGTWRLTAMDMAAGDVGTIENFQLFLNNEPAGACCLADGSCVQATQGNCAAQSGVFQSPGLACSAANCPQPGTGACCLPDGTCAVLSQAACTAQGGIYRGNSTACAAAACPSFYRYLGFSVAIPDLIGVNGTAGAPATASINVPDHGTIADVEVGFVIEHPFQGDLRVRLMGPGGQEIDLVTRPGVAPPKFTPGTTAGFGFGTDNYGTMPLPFIGDDEASRGIYDSALGAPGVGTAAGVTDVQGRWKPVQALSVFDGTDPFGIWTLTVTDHAQADAGVLHDVRLYINTSGGPAACYANCDRSTIPPCLNVNDFLCFTNSFGAGNPSANCDGSTIAPVLNVNDFICFNNRFGAGCATPCAAP